MHAGQLTVSPGMVRELVNDQFPGWRHLAVTALASPGTVNAIFRIGDQLAARFPLRAMCAGRAGPPPAEAAIWAVCACSSSAACLAKGDAERHGGAQAHDAGFQVHSQLQRICPSGPAQLLIGLDHRQQLGVD
jgi:hypothetical protein